MFVGRDGIEQVQQPDGTELCFASIVTAMTGASVPEAHAAMLDQGLSQEDGSTAPMGEVQLPVGGTVLEIKPVVDPFGVDTPEGAMGAIDEELVAARAVALLYKKLENPTDDQHHWTLLTGYLESDGVKGSFRVMDPLRPRIDYLRRTQVEGMVKRSMEFMGVYAYALDTVE